MKKRLAMILALLVGANFLALGQNNIVINEFLASNVATNADIVDFGDFSDWIELYNGGNADVDIGGYALTDDPGKPGKWKFPAGTIIRAKGFLMVWADGYDEVPGKTHQRSYYPNDQFTTRYFHLNFKLDQAGEYIGLSGPDGILRDSVTFGLQQSDVSRGRKPDGSPNWFYFGEPTPADSNSTEGIQSTQHAGTPVVSPESGFLTGNQLVTIGSQPYDAQIRYTLDGSRPTSLSPLYTNPVAISQTTVIRVRVFEQGKLPSVIVTRTYFINENITLPVISISTNPELLWDQNSGIYTNSFKERNLPVHFEFFEPGGSPGFNIDAELNLTGQLSLYYPQKSFTISSDNRFGTDVMEYRFFPQRELNTFTSLYLRNGGVPDNRSTLLRDDLLHTLVINKMDLDCQAYRPSVVFLNGAYWGIYSLREKINSSYLGTLHNLNPTDVDLLEYEGNVEPTLMEGQSDNFHSFFSYISNNDLSRTDNYRYIQTWMDVDEFINYQICEIYCDNVVWLDENVRMWRERKDGARWRWVLFDTDFGFGMPSQMSKGYTNNTLRFATSSNTGDPVIAPLWSTLLFRKLLLNQEFKTKFIQRFASYLNSVFHPDTVVSVVNQMQVEVSPGMPRHISRWRNGDYYYGYPIPDYPTWLGNVAVVKTFARNRPLFQRQHIIEYFGLSGTSAMSMDIASPGSGRIVVNGIENVRGSSSGIYFKGVTTGLEAVPALGYRFVRWEGIDSVYQNPVDVTVTQDSLHITALFQPVTINTVPAHISSDTTLTAGHSPYYAQTDVTVDSAATLRLAEGVHVLMPEAASLVIHGRLLVEGTAGNPVVIAPNEHSKTWGALCWVNASDSSAVSYLNVVGATKGPDFTRDRAALSGYNSRILLQNVSVENVQAPVCARLGRVFIKNCRLHTTYAGDLINIKYADYALVENCDLRGSSGFDSDGIDFDGDAAGIIRGNRIYDLYGFNSDAIDLGEGAKNILVENNIIYNICDKGVSVGQGSTTTIRHNLIANCGMGIGVKDFNSYAHAEHNTFYGNHTGVASYEKIIGHGGGNADVVNCILANSLESALFVDHLSILTVSYSLSNTDTLPGSHNLKADPRFVNNLYLSSTSPAIDKGNPLLPADPDGSLPDIGAYPFDQQKLASLIIDEIHYHPLEGESYQFIELVNPGPSTLNLSGYRLTGSIEYKFGAVTVASGEYIVIAKSSSIYDGQGYRVFQWDTGTLPATVGSLLLSDDKGSPIDRVDYDNRDFWPSQPDGLGPSLELHHTSLENMVSTSWRGSYVKGGTPGHSASSVLLSGIYINEFMAENDTSYADEKGEHDDWIEIYNANSLPIDIGGLYATDNLNKPNKCLIPRNDPQQTTIPSHGFLILWADGQTDQGIRHLNFKLDRTGEQIGLAEAANDQFVFIDSLTYTGQTADVSYGRYPDGSKTWRTFNHPTPLASNQSTNGVAEKPPLALRFSLAQNYPNPFNPSATIQFSIKNSEFLILKVYDLLGREVATLVNERKSPGIYTVTFDGSNLSSGVYFYRLTSGQKVETRKMVLVR